MVTMFRSRTILRNLNAELFCGTLSHKCKEFPLYIIIYIFYIINYIPVPSSINARGIHGEIMEFYCHTCLGKMRPNGKGTSHECNSPKRKRGQGMS